MSGARTVKENPVPDFIMPPQNSNSPFADLRGHHVAVRAPSLAEATDFYVGKLDFRVVAEWDFEDEKHSLRPSASPPPQVRFRIRLAAISAISACPAPKTYQN